MAAQDNPAEQLLAFLTRFSRASMSGRKASEVWSDVLGVEDPGTLLPYRAHVAGLFADVAAAVDASGDRRQREVFDAFSAEWARPVFWSTADDDERPPVVESRALAALGGLAAVFSASASASAVATPPEVTSEAVRLHLRALHDATVAATDLSPSARAMLTEHVHRFAWALDQVTLAGPGTAPVPAELHQPRPPRRPRWPGRPRGAGSSRRDEIVTPTEYYTFGPAARADD